MMTISDGRTPLGHLKPLSRGYDVFDLDGVYRGKVDRPGEAAALLRAAIERPARKIAATSTPRAPGARARRSA